MSESYFITVNALDEINVYIDMKLFIAFIEEVTKDGNIK